jgi:hypothetical protein
MGGACSLEEMKNGYKILAGKLEETTWKSYA